jgi:hypothetical protein
MFKPDKHDLHGDYPRVGKNVKCHHGRYGYEGCETCIDEYFDGLLAKSNSLKVD